MFSNYIKIAWRNLWKHKTFSVIVVFGMAIAFAASLLLSVTAYHELSYDQFHQNKERIFQLYTESQSPRGVEKSSTLAVPLTPALKSELVDIKHITRWGSSGGEIGRYNGKELNLSIRSVDPDFLSLFTFPISAGDKKAPLRELNDIVITKHAANRFFDKEEAVGKTIDIKTPKGWQSFRVTAVTEDFPENSSLTFDVLSRFEHFSGYDERKDAWDSENHEVFVELREGVTTAAFEKQMQSIVKKYYVQRLEDLKRDGVRPDREGTLMRLRTIPITDIHFNEISNTGAGVSIFYTYLLLSISLFIIFIACVNFVNLSLARSFTRSKEIGIRKVMGALRWQLISQFWGEAFIVSVLALAAGVLIAWLLLPFYKQVFYPSLSVEMLRSPLLIIYILAAFALITLIAGGYPAWLVSKFNTIQTVKGKLPVGKSNRLRNSLMVVQFVLSSLLIICTLIVWQQLDYLRNKPLGYNKQQVLSIPVGPDMEGQTVLNLLRNKLAAEPKILSITGTDMNMGRGRDGSSTTSMMGFGYKERTVTTHWLRVDYDFLKTMDVRLLNGRDFDRSYGLDSGGVLINETMAKQLGEKDPLSAVLNLDGGQLKVLGVVKDYHFKSLHQELAPLTMVIRPNWPLTYIFIRVQPENLPASVAVVEKAWKEVNPKTPYRGSFLDENTDRSYQRETRMSRIFMSGAVLAILISCMGLFAIALLAILQRTKEIGIRKVLGASVPQIVGLVSKDFMLLVMIAIVIASPIAWFTMHKWLQSFYYRIDIAWWVFALAGVMALVIAFITLSMQSIKAALRNPVKSLRSE
ncbi:ABC transporter permease [Paraflavitalea sp. CAU 1676]|uniref:ABC transporter permease n=1 Tax=Paraflavitalea sp. CAU 1676 TaxID=3032598 RepID=UPI0023DA5D4A|nr:ABC transporter permease [Paraflavitalea sp. CAU 1676]MDF2192024.1 ABC transporter permease [Paraflavitalea sp. CAU 1676]